MCDSPTETRFLELALGSRRGRECWSAANDTSVATLCIAYVCTRSRADGASCARSAADLPSSADARSAYSKGTPCNVFVPVDSGVTLEACLARNWVVHYAVGCGSCQSACSSGQIEGRVATVALMEPIHNIMGLPDCACVQLVPRDQQADQVTRLSLPVLLLGIGTVLRTTVWSWRCKPTRTQQ
jgi:hypothetical protein